MATLGRFTTKMSWADMEDDSDDDLPLPANLQTTGTVPQQPHEEEQKESRQEESEKQSSAAVSPVIAPVPAPVAAAKSAPAAAPKSAVPAWSKPLPIASSAVGTTSPAPVAAVAASAISAVATAAPATAAVVPTAAAVKPASSATTSAHVPKKSAPSTFKTWGDLTASMGGSKPVVSAPPAVVPARTLPAGLDEADEEPAAGTAAVAFDPYLDSSRDGLPLMFKGLSKSPAEDLSVVMEEESSKSRQGTKRKEMEETETVSPAAVDMTALVAGFKSAAPAPAPAKPAWGGAGLVQAKSAQPIAPIAAEVQQPTTGKKMKATDGKPKNVQSATATTTTTNAARPNSFLAAVTGVDASVTAAAATAATPAAVATPPVVDMAQRLKQRQKQIAMGKNTPEYQNYIKMVPISQRTSSHPRTPDVRKKCSKRSMDGQVRQWRRLLHEYDPVVVAAKADGTYVEPKKGDNDDASASEAEMVDHSEAEDDFVHVQ